MANNYDEQNFVDERGHNVIMFSADFLETDFNRLRNEYKEKGYITWEIKGKGATDIKKGDICYIYYTHLPSVIGYDQSRVLLRAIVKDKPKCMTKQEIYGERAKEPIDKTKGFTIEDINPIELKDYKKYSWEVLNTKYNFGRAPSTTRKLFNKNSQLFKDIESTFKKSNKGFEELIEYFNTPCFFEKTLHKGKGRLTFVKRNGLYYYEKHHFVPQYTGRVKNDFQFQNIIDSPENIINLCPFCHRKIHHGTPEEIMEMLELIYKDKEIFLKESNMNQLIDEEDILNWIKESLLMMQKKGEKYYVLDKV